MSVLPLDSYDSSVPFRVAGRVVELADIQTVNRQIMPPMGGVRMSAEDIRAVSAYVYSLTPAKWRKRD